MAGSTPPSDIDALSERLAARIKDALPRAIAESLEHGINVAGDPVQIECNILWPKRSPASGLAARRTRLATVELDASDSPRSLAVSPPVGHGLPLSGPADSSSPWEQNPQKRFGEVDPADAAVQVAKRPRLGQKASSLSASSPDNGMTLASSYIKTGTSSPRRKKRMPERPDLQPSTLDKFLNGVWDTIYSGIKVDPAEVIEQWQALEGTGPPRLLVENEHRELQRETRAQENFGRMNVLTRKLSQASRTCRSLEVVVQTHWIQCFDDRVAELMLTHTRDKARKQTIAEACMDFKWSEKELRNKMGIWRGYHDIMSSGGWVALVFAGAGLYRFCKYRVSFTEETFEILRSLRHRFEVAADTLHPRWRQLFGIVGESPKRKYTGHPHDWVVCGPGNTAIPLPQTYYQWDKNFSYQHLDTSVIDQDYWGNVDPRMGVSETSPEAFTCQVCEQRQSDNPRENQCNCFPNLYGGTKAGFTPVQVFRTPDGKNNGLIACCAFETGVAIGEFVGQITGGLAGMDVMVGQTDKGTYQIWQGRSGNHTRFVNHSCWPNAQYERFVWLGTQRIVLVSKGVEAGEEITVDYSDTYWKDLDKVCLCGHENCRYKDRRTRQLPSST